MLRRSAFSGLLAVLSLGLTSTQMVGSEPNRSAAVESGDYTAELNGLKLWYKVSGQGPICLMPTPGWGAKLGSLLPHVEVA